VSKAAKRERQRLNREARRAYEEKLARRRRARKTGRRLAIFGSPVLVVFVILAITNGGGSSSSVTCATVKVPAPRPTAQLAAPTQGIQSSVRYTAVITTSCGTIQIDLDAQRYPKAVNNFVALANQDFYNNLAFVRVAKDFVIQAGSPDESNQTTNTGPGYTVQAEVPTTTPANRVVYPVGTVAFAKTGAEPAGTASSQFFIVTGRQGTGLTPDYAVIGTVTKGLDVAKQIASFAPAGGDGMPTTPVVIRSVRILTSSGTTPTSY
jgi:peptidyl-prolyl cis-trans isomerase B (cyclophilin B)